MSDSTNKQHTENQHQNSRKATHEQFQNLLITLGQQLASQFDLSNVAQLEEMTPEKLKQVVHKGKDIFKSLLEKMLTKAQLSSISAVFNKVFLQNMSTGVLGPQAVFIQLAIQLLIKVGIPTLQSIIQHATSTHQKSEVGKKREAYHPVHGGQSDHVPSSAALHHGQVAQNVGAAYHRMTSGNRGSK